jgi:hypothetical protein
VPNSAWVLLRDDRCGRATFVRMPIGTKAEEILLEASSEGFDVTGKVVKVAGPADTSGHVRLAGFRASLKADKVMYLV